jgi:hypothetical protein
VHEQEGINMYRIAAQGNAMINGSKSSPNTQLVAVSAASAPFCRTALRAAAPRTLLSAHVGAPLILNFSYRSAVHLGEIMVRSNLSHLRSSDCLGFLSQKNQKIAYFVGV